MKKQGQMHFVSSWALVLTAFLFEVLAKPLDQSGFISLDCGLPANKTYTSSVTGISYISDAAFIDTGVSKEIRDKHVPTDPLFWYLRSFPKGIRNCYTLNVKKGQKYLIRAYFVYGTFVDNKYPEFDVYLGVSFWVSIDEMTSYYEEIIHVVSTNRLRLCLADKGKGAPFISSIELRPLPYDMYQQYGDPSLLIHKTMDAGNYRYRLSVNGGERENNGDIYDRIWTSDGTFGLQALETTIPVIDKSENIDYPPPSTELTPNQSRVFAINSSSGGITHTDFIPTYLTTEVAILYETFPAVKEPVERSFSLIRGENSTLPPLINAIEVFEGTYILDSQTQEEDVDAMFNIKSVYNVTTRNWQGDPCGPKAFIWDGIRCAKDASITSSIISLNLSSADLTGNISSYISNLTSLQVLDLSYNYLIGPLPNFLSDMKFLKVLNLSGNNLTGAIPTKLLDKSKHRSLSLSLDGNPYLCHEEVCNVAIINTNTKKKKNLLPIKVGIAAGSLLIIILATMAICWRLRFPISRGLGPLPLGEANSLRIRYSEISTVTDNFKTVIGEGGFGKVYLGQLGGKEVAVKMLSASSCQGQKEFQAEAELLMRVHHTNLISLIGYCDDDNHLGLVYEYMTLGNLRMRLSEKKENTLSWEQRLQIATDAAQGLDYLHRGCKPPMIHRDVKSSNILISEQFNGKVADFGLSRASPLAGGSHETTTVVAGTLGYLDPEYFATNKLNEKSDVYSFGIVLMEIVTSRSVIGTSSDDHIIQYVNKMICTGDISGIIDPRLKGDADVNSVWRVLELATTCVAQDSTRRPNMINVAMELDECLASIRNPGGKIGSSVKATFTKLSMESGPEAR